MEIIRRGKILRYREHYYLNGAKINGPCFERKTDAKEWKTQMLAKRSTVLAHGDEPIHLKGQVPFKDFAKMFLEQFVKIESSPRTYIIYESMLRVHLMPNFQNIALNKITEEMGLNLIQKLKKNGHNAKGINNIMMMFKCILNKAVQKKYLVANPFISISKQKDDLICDAYWTKSEIGQFLLANNQHELYPLFFVALHTGMRLGELCGLCWDRIDFGLNQITITRIRDKYGTKETTKTRLKRILPMVPEVRSLLIQLMREQRHPKYVFATRSGQLIDYGHIYRDFCKAQKTAKFDRHIRFHDLRHTFASQFMMNGGSVFELQKILGHTDIKMTMRYAHFSPEHLQSSIKFMSMGVTNQFESSFSKSSPNLAHGQNFDENILDFKGVK